MTAKITFFFEKRKHFSKKITPKKAKYSRMMLLF
jgi:hypothetical protein